MLFGESRLQPFSGEPRIRVYLPRSQLSVVSLISGSAVPKRFNNANPQSPIPNP